MSKLQRFYVGNELELKHDFWVNDAKLIQDWNGEHVLIEGQDVLLANESHERLYKIVEINDQEIHLQYVTDFKLKS